MSDDPDESISTALTVALATQHLIDWKTALAPDGDGLRVQGVGSVTRAYDRDELPFEFQDDAAVDPVANEIWSIRSGRTRAHPHGVGPPSAATNCGRSSKQGARCESNAREL